MVIKVHIGASPVVATCGDIPRGPKFYSERSIAGARERVSFMGQLNKRDQYEVCEHCERVAR